MNTYGAFYQDFTSDIPGARKLGFGNWSTPTQAGLDILKKDIAAYASTSPATSASLHAAKVREEIAGTGSLKTRTEQFATLSGRPTLWTYHAAAAALTQANATARPQGPNRPTADELWKARPTITAEQRALFQDSVNQERDHVRLTEGWPSIGPLKDKDARALDRHAIRRALCGHGFLFIQRRTIPLRFNAKITAIIR
jgi:hypothetical protein